MSTATKTLQNKKQENRKREMPKRMQHPPPTKKHDKN